MRDWPVRWPGRGPYARHFQVASALLYPDLWSDEYFQPFNASSGPSDPPHLPANLLPFKQGIVGIGLSVWLNTGQGE